MSPMKLVVACLAIVAFASVALVSCLPSISSQSASEAIKVANELEQVSPRSALARFLFYNSHPSERHASSVALTGSGQLGYKRSSSAASLDPIETGLFGKRSAPTMELVNLEPVFGRQLALRTSPRMYDFRWAPLDSIDAPLAYENNY